MERIQIKSSQIASIGYDPGTQTLEIEFRPTRADSTATSVYQYSDVSPGVFNALMGAPSQGSFFYKHIKGIYAYRKIE